MWHTRISSRGVCVGVGCGGGGGGGGGGAVYTITPWELSHYLVNSNSESEAA